MRDDRATDGFSWGKKGDAEAQAVLDAQTQTPQDRLAAALTFMPAHVDMGGDEIWRREQIAARILAADPSIAADMELGRRIRDANDPLLETALDKATVTSDLYDVGDTVSEDALRAALTEDDWLDGLDEADNREADSATGIRP